MRFYRAYIAAIGTLPNIREQQNAYYRLITAVPRAT